MKILIFEQAKIPTGHPIPYASLIANSITAIGGTSVVVCFPKQIEDSECCQVYFPENDLIKLRFYPLPEVAGLRHCQATADEFLKAVNDVQPDYVLIPTADGLATVLAYRSWRGKLKTIQGTPIDILLMRGEHLHSATRLKRRIQKWIEWKVVLAGPWSRILHLDPLVWAKNRKQMELCPDPVPTPTVKHKQAARTLLDLPKDRPIVVSVGDQTEPKGVDLLITAFHESTIPDEFCLLIAGPMSDGIRTMADVLRNKRGNDSVIVKDCFLSDTEFEAAIIAADLVAVPYKSTSQPSGVACRAIAWGKPMIGTNSGWIKWACEVFDAGFVTNTSDSSQFSKRIVSGLEEAKEFEQSTASRAFSQFNSVENYCRMWRKGIAGKLRINDETAEVPPTLASCFEGIPR